MTGTQRDDTTHVLSSADLADMNGEPRMSHKRIALALGMAQHHKLRHMIERNLVEFQRYGEVPSMVDETSKQGGRPGKVVMLNEGQAILASVRSDAPLAPDVRYQVITAFMEWRGAKHPAPSIPVKAHDRRPSTKMDNAISLARSADRLESVASQMVPRNASLTWIDGQPVAYDAEDYRVPDGTMAVVMYQGGRISVEPAEWGGDGRCGLGAYRPMAEIHGSRCRPVFTILGRVMNQHSPSNHDLKHDSARRNRPANNNSTRPVYRDAVLCCLAKGMALHEIVEQTGASIWTVQKWQKKRRQMAA